MTTEKPVVQGLCDDCRYRGTFEGREHDVDDWRCNLCGYPCTWVTECKVQIQVGEENDERR